MILDCWGQRSLQNRSSEISCRPSDGARKGHATSKRPRYAGFCFLAQCIRACFVIFLFFSVSLSWPSLSRMRALALRLDVFLTDDTTFVDCAGRKTVLLWTYTSWQQKQNRARSCAEIGCLSVLITRYSSTALEERLFRCKYICVGNTNRTVRALALRLDVFLF